MPALTYNAANQITTAGYAYDGTGNLTATPTATYAYNGFQQMTAATTGGVTSSDIYAGADQKAVFTESSVSHPPEVPSHHINQGRFHVLTSPRPDRHRCPTGVF